MTEIQVLDDFLSDDELSHIRDYLDRPFRRSETVSWQLQRTSDDSSIGLAATDFLYMDVTDVAFFNHYLLEKIQYELGVDYKASEIYFNGQWPDRHGSFHTDFSKKTVLIYISECDTEWGGFTQFYSSWDDCRQMKDPLVNNSGTAISSSITLRDAINKPVLGPRASTTETTTDRNVYEITTNSGLAFSTSGSGVRYANLLSADLDYIATLYPNAIANMRSRMKTLGHKEWIHLPLWMRTAQTSSGVPLGYTMAVPICFCKPGTSALIKKRITDKELNFKNIHFIIDRYQVGNSKVTTGSFTGDGSTTAFNLGELVHEEDILVKQGGVIAYVGDNVTADNNLSPLYLSSDTQLRSADFENELTLTHDTSNKQTTVTFNTAPTDGTIITVGRVTDKYLIFRNKGI